MITVHFHLREFFFYYTVAHRQQGIAQDVTPSVEKHL